MSSSVIKSKIFDQNSVIVHCSASLNSYCSGCYAMVHATIGMDNRTDYDTNIFDLGAGLYSPETVFKTSSLISTGDVCIKPSGASLSPWYVSIRSENNIVLKIHVTNNNTSYPVNSSIKIDINMNILTV